MTNITISQVADALEALNLSASRTQIYGDNCEWFQIDLRPQVFFLREIQELSKKFGYARITFNFTGECLTISVHPTD